MLVHVQMIEAMARLCLQIQLPHTETMEIQLLVMAVMRHEQLRLNGNVQEVIQLQRVHEMIFVEMDLLLLPQQVIVMTETQQIVMVAIVLVQLSQNGSVL